MVRTSLGPGVISVLSFGANADLYPQDGRYIAESALGLPQAIGASPGPVQLGFCLKLKRPVLDMYCEEGTGAYALLLKGYPVSPPSRVPYKFGGVPDQTVHTPFISVSLLSF